MALIPHTSKSSGTIFGRFLLQTGSSAQNPRTKNNNIIKDHEYKNAPTSDRISAHCPSLSLVGLFRGLVHQESTSSGMLDLLGFLVSFPLILFPYLTQPSIYYIQYTVLQFFILLNILVEFLSFQISFNLTNLLIFTVCYKKYQYLVQ